MLLFGLEQKYFRTPSVSFSPYSTLKFSLNWKVIDFVIQAKTRNRSNKQVKSQIQVSGPKKIFFLRVNVVIVVPSNSS